MHGPSTSSPREGGYFAVIGGVLLIPPAIWSSFFAGGGYGFLTTAFMALGLLGTFLATAGLFPVYALTSENGGPKGRLWASLGTAVVALSLFGLVFYGVQELRGAEPDRLYLASSVLSWWIRPLGVVLFAFALVRADILFGRALLLFLVAFLEIPVLSNLMLDAAGGAGWGTLLFGFPGLQTGLIGALSWIAFGYSLLLLDEHVPSYDDPPDETAYDSPVHKA